MSKARVRYAPSPTGIPHIGNIRTALFNYLFVKNPKNSGDFILRIEDTDQNRLVPQAVEKIKESLNLLGLVPDEEYHQSKRLEIYKKHLEVLKEKSLVYEDESAWRFKVEKSHDLEWDDIVHGTVKFSSDVIEDFIIIKSDGYPTYHFASVIDDHDMQISHVFRGDEWISSTPKHLLLYQSFGWEPPKFVHLPPILGEGHKKLSKRDGAKSVIEYIDEGYLPEALVNFLAFLGWSPKDEREIFSLEELTHEFSLDRINKNSPIFNVEKLKWFSREWIKKMPDEKLSELIHKKYPDYELSKIIQTLPAVKDRINTVADFKEIAELFFKEPDSKDNLKDISVSSEILKRLILELEKIDWSEEKISAVVSAVMEENKLSKAQMYRSIGIALSGKLVTPPIFSSMEILGKDETLARLKACEQK